MPQTTTQRIGRPPKAPADKQSCSVQIYCTPEQKAEIKRLAAADDRSISSFIVRAVLK